MALGFFIPLHHDIALHYLFLNSTSWTSTYLDNLKPPDSDNLRWSSLALPIDSPAAPTTGPPLAFLRQPRQLVRPAPPPWLLTTHYRQQTPTFLYSLPVTTLIRPLLLLRLYHPLPAYLLEHRHDGPVTPSTDYTDSLLTTGAPSAPPWQLVLPAPPFWPPLNLRTWLFANCFPDSFLNNWQSLRLYDNSHLALLLLFTHEIYFLDPILLFYRNYCCGWSWPEIGCFYSSLTLL